MAPSPDQLASWTLRRLVVPLGRTVGDNNCAYDAFDVCAIQIRTGSGVSGWGFGEMAHGGVFRKPVSWKSPDPMPSETALADEFARAWPSLEACSVRELLDALPPPWIPWRVGRPTHAALRMALWDLHGKLQGQPLHRLLGGPQSPTSAFAYASPCGFPQTTEWVVRFFEGKVREGFRAIKVKVGHEDIEWDMSRLRAIREAVGPDIQVAVDANTAWDGAGTLRWIDRAEREGLNLRYVEDPVWPDDLDSYRLLASESPLPIVGHDYIPHPDGLRQLLDTGALSAIRMRDGIDYALAADRLAVEYGLPLIQCNTFGEHLLHFSLGNPRVERVEFADIGWNRLFAEPVRAAEGRLHAPGGPGLGLEPKHDILEALHQPEPPSKTLP